MQYSELSERSKAPRVLLAIVTVQCDDFRWKCRVFQKVFYSGNPNVTVRPALRKGLHLKAYELSIIQRVERRAVCTPLSAKVFVTLAAQ
jgi:hypothetical protein